MINDLLFNYLKYLFKLISLVPMTNYQNKISDFIWKINFWIKFLIIVNFIQLFELINMWVSYLA
jgi:hypothetical protein